ncbi:MAG: methyltransferase domain-containing protein [Candidatus Nitronauta litoralis]|uniref:Methyltransferase domain-containing protein n=1 Tax=Candidatus Nitronauta litoralis TaxID=2705533 RepID=A0A7T0G1C9_9BACT|nr:MAG: methyltransferase domain-containing protein [Candidatus Nitronauta litoralis]
MSQSAPKPDYEEKLIESFSKHARNYERHAQLQRSMAERLASMLPCPLPQPILEIGCGTGFFTKHLLSKEAKQLYLNDLAPGMLETVKNQLSLPPKCELLLGNAEHMKFPKVRMITGNAVFQWFQSPQETLSEFTQFLEKNGNVLFNTFGSKTLQEFRYLGSLESPNFLLTSERWENSLKSAGYKITCKETEERHVFFPSTRELLKNLQQIGAAPIRMLKPSELKKLIRDYDEEFKTDQGVYTQWELLYFSASKL